MAEYLIQSETLESMADKIRILNGVEGALTTAQMDSNLGEANDEVGSQADLIAQIKSTVNALPVAGNGGIDTSDATATASTILNGYTAYVAGEKITGNIQSQAAQTITPSTTDKTIAAGKYLAGAQTIKGDANLVASNIKSGVSIFGVSGTLTEVSGGSGGSSEDTETLNSLLNGTITGYSNSTMSKVRGGLFMDCGNLSNISLPACQNIDKLAFRYCTQLSDANFPVCSSVGESAFFYCTKLTSISFPQCKTIGSMAFAQCSQLQSIDLPECTVISVSAFASCKSMTTVNIPLCTTLYQQAFRECVKLVNISTPSVSNISTSAFLNCNALTTISLPNAQTLNNTAFQKCYNLKSLYLMGSSLCTLKNSNAFSSTPIGGYSASAGTYGSIYVPASLLTSYQAATNWTYFSSRFVGV